MANNKKAKPRLILSPKPLVDHEKVEKAVIYAVNELAKLEPMEDRIRKTKYAIVQAAARSMDDAGTEKRKICRLLIKEFELKHANIDATTVYLALDKQYKAATGPKKTRTSNLLSWEFLVRDLTRELTGLSGADMGRISEETERGTSWRHEVVERTKDFRFRMIKKLSEIDRKIGPVQTLQFILEDFTNQLHHELLAEKRKGELLTE